MNLAVRNLGLPLLAVLLFEGAGSAKCVDHTPRFLATDLGCLYQGADCASAATSVSHNRPTDTTTTLAQVYVAGYSSAPGGVKHAFVWHQAWTPSTPRTEP